MAEKMNGNKVGLTLGFFFAILHALWALIVAVGLGETILNWVFPLHFIDLAYAVLPFSLGYAIVLVILSFVAGYLMGWLFTLLWNCKCKKRR